MALKISCEKCPGSDCSSKQPEYGIKIGGEVISVEFSGKGVFHPNKDGVCDHYDGPGREIYDTVPPEKKEELAEMARRREEMERTFGK